LYHSDVVLGFDMADIEVGIRRVWASVFSERAYLERRGNGLKEAEVGICVLAMPLLKDCVAINGVAIHTNPYRPDLGGAVINAQIGTVAVTDSCNGATAEQVVYFRDDAHSLSLQYLSLSSLVPKGQYLISEQTAKILLDTMVMAERTLGCGSGLGTVNIEFFVLKNGDVVLLQARLISVQLRPWKKLRDDDGGEEADEEEDDA
jgi:hypothetical protein